MNTRQYAAPHDQIRQDRLRLILNNLLQVLEKESAQLESGREDFFEAMAREKLKIFADLDRYMRENATLEFSDENKLLLKNSKARMKQNMSSLEFRMNAIGEIARTIEDAVMEAESDGTYRAGGSRGVGW
jgi:flagellar biosynthesis/type III secretory pathway chaperone